MKNSKTAIEDNPLKIKSEIGAIEEVEETDNREEEVKIGKIDLDQVELDLKEFDNQF